MYLQKLYGVVLITAILLCLSTSVSAGSGGGEEFLLKLQKMIELQQKQLDEQAAQIADMRRQLGQNSKAIEQKTDQSTVSEVNPDTTVNSKFENVDVNLYGQINRALLATDNGNSSETYFVDNSHSSTRMGLDAIIGVNEDFSTGGKIEYGLRANPSSRVDQENLTIDADVNIRHADLYFISKTFGQIYLGLGSMAGDGTSTIDLSGTNIVTSVTVNDMAGGQLWSESGSDTNSQESINHFFGDLDGFRLDRLRYDSPSLHGLTLSSSIATEDFYDLALRFNRQYGDVKIATALAWQSPSDIVDNIYNGSMSVLIDNSFNLTLAGGVEDSDDIYDGSFWYSKLGYKANIFDHGTTAFSIDYGQFDDFLKSTDLLVGGDAKVWSLAVVHDVPHLGTEFYLAFRQYKYDNEAVSYDDINVVMSGARLKF